MKKSNKRCIFGTWVTVDRIDNRVVIDSDDFNINIMLVGQEIVPGLGRKYLISSHNTIIEDENPTPNFFAFHYTDEEEAAKNLMFGSENAVHYRVTSTDKGDISMSNHPINGFESIVKEVSSLIKKTPSKVKGRKIKNEFQDHIINEWYRGKVSESCSKVLKKPLIELADGLSFLTSSLYRKIKSNMGNKKLTSYFSRMVALRFHCEEFRGDSDFINDFFKHNIVSHMLNNSYLDNSLAVRWCRRDFDNYHLSEVTPLNCWRDLFIPNGVEYLSKRYVIDNLPRSIPSPVVHKISECNIEFEQKSADRMYILFRTFLRSHTEKRINKILDSKMFSIDDLKDSLKVFNDFIYKFDGIIKSKKSYKRRNKLSYRKTSVVSSFCSFLEKSSTLILCDEIENSGFCFPSLLELTKSICLENMDKLLVKNSSLDLDRITKNKKDKLRKMKEKFLKDYCNAISVENDLNLTFVA